MLPKILAHRLSCHLLIIIYQCTQTIIISNWILRLIENKNSIISLCFSGIGHNLGRIVFDQKVHSVFRSVAKRFIWWEWDKMWCRFTRNWILLTADHFDLSIFHKVLMTFISFECHYQLNFFRNISWLSMTCCCFIESIKWNFYVFFDW